MSLAAAMFLIGDRQLEYSVMTSTIYTIYPSNDHKPLGAKMLKGNISVGHRFNVKSLLAGWKAPEYVFYEVKSGKKCKIPSSAILIGGGLAVRVAIKEKLFPSPSDMLEFLTLRVEDEEWSVVNCLHSTSNYDSDESVLYRSTNGEIYMVNHLVINGNSLDVPEIFVIDGSNRAAIFANQSFVDRYRALKLEGLTFRKIGEVRV